VWIGLGALAGVLAIVTIIVKRLRKA